MSGPLSDGEMAALADVTCGRRLHDGTECEKPVGHRGWCLDGDRLVSGAWAPCRPGDVATNGMVRRSATGIERWVEPHPWPGEPCCGLPFDHEVHDCEVVRELREMARQREHGAAAYRNNAARAARAAQLRADARARRRAWWVHNLIAHPLLVLCPPAGEWLHDRTAPEGDR